MILINTIFNFCWWISNKLIYFEVYIECRGFSGLYLLIFSSHQKCELVDYILWCYSGIEMQKLWLLRRGYISLVSNIHIKKTDWKYIMKKKVIVNNLTKNTYKMYMYMCIYIYIFVCGNLCFVLIWCFLLQSPVINLNIL